MKMNGAEIMVKSLEDLGVDRVFGYSGAAILPVFDALGLSPIAITVIAIDGDGSIRMNMGEIHTIGSLGIPIKVLLLNNRADGMVRTLQAVAFGRRFTATERGFDADFSRIAGECGFAWHRKVRRRGRWTSS
jgi:acetolactate synthase I/II/III large subunit